MLESFPLYRQSGSTNVAEAVGDGAAPYLLLTIAFISLVFFFELWLDLRQIALFDPTTAKIPPRLSSVVKEYTFKKSIAYRKDVFSFKIAEATFGYVNNIGMTLGGFLPWSWDAATVLSARLVAAMGYKSISPFVSEALTTWLFVVVLTLVDMFTSVPFSFYQTFVVEERHGFNKSSLGLFIKDKMITLAIAVGLSLPVLSGMIYIMGVGGQHFYLYVWAFLCALSVVMMTIYPIFIAPLFNKYSDLEEGETMEAIRMLAKRVDFPLTQIYSVDGSRRSAHSNAYFYGFFKNKRIVLYDTLMKQVTLPELMAILGHEMGHWKLWHTLQNFLVTQLYIFALFLSFSYVQHSAALFEAFGFHFTKPMPVFIGLMLFMQTFWGPVDKALSFVMTRNSRKNEFAADRFAAQLDMGPDLVTGLIKISTENLDNLVPDAWYSWYHYSHPPLVERIAAIENNQRKSQ